MLQLNLEKPGVAPQKLQLSLNKGAKFKVVIFWDCDPKHRDDMDTHALEVSDGKIFGGYGAILSTYNTDRMAGKKGVLKVKGDNSFATMSGGLTHSADIRVQGNSETIEIDGSQLPAEVNEVPLFATVHETDEEHHEDGEDEAAFADIELVKVTIVDDKGQEIATYVLSKEFGEFNVVQLGSIMLGENGWEYVAVGRGFKGNFNDVLGFFS